MPTSSWLHDCYSAELSQEVKVVKGVPAGWGVCSRTLSFHDIPLVHTSWKDLIIVALFSFSYNIITIDAITGAYLSILSGHTQGVESLTFSSDGTLLVSGDQIGIIKLWDVQTGVVVRTLEGHTSEVCSVSISPDHTMIASGSQDKTIRLWDTWTGECHCIIDGHNDTVISVSFSPTDSQLLISASRDNTVQWWDVHGHQIGPTYVGTHIAISPDGTYFASWGYGKPVVTVWNSGSRVVVTELQIPSKNCCCCQFSPNGKSVALGAGNIIYIWDITNPAPHLIRTFIGHSRDVVSITFSSSLISSSMDGSVKLWQLGTPPMDPAAIDLDPTLLASAPIKYVRLQQNDGIALSADSAGGVRSWDISTGLCQASFHSPTEDLSHGDMRLVDSGLIVVWKTSSGLHIWDTKGGGSTKVVNTQWESQRVTLKISGDGSKVICLVKDYIQTFSIQTGELVGEVRLEGSVKVQKFLIGDGSRVWVYYKDSQTQGWDFGVSGSTPISLPEVVPDGPHLELTTQGNPKRYTIVDKVTGNVVFQLSGKYAHPTTIKWDGQYLVAGYETGEVLILDFNHIPPLYR